MAINGQIHSCRHCLGTIIVGKGEDHGITWHESPVCKSFIQLIKDGKDLRQVILLEKRKRGKP